jgi:hypothetical protein
MQKLLRYFFIGVLLPLLVQYVCYYQFTTNYTTNAFSKESFSRMYNTSVYKSRIIGKELQLWTYEQLNKIGKVQNIRNAAENDLMMNKKRLQFMDPSSDPVFYLSYFVLATVFTILTSLILLLIFDIRQLFPGDIKYYDLLVCFFILLTGLTQFVITPYDNPGYFFMAVAMLLFLKYFATGKSFYFIILLLTIAIATFNRETSLLILAFMAAVFYSEEGLQLSWIKKMILPVLFFVLPYLFLKFFFSGGTDLTEESKLSVNLDIRNSYAIRGLAFGAFLLYFMLYILNRNRKRLVLYFLIFSLPYLIIIHVVGVMIEYRLWMPVVLGAVVLSQFHSSKTGGGTVLQNANRI